MDFSDRVVDRIEPSYHIEFEKALRTFSKRDVRIRVHMRPNSKRPNSRDRDFELRTSDVSLDSAGQVARSDDYNTSV